MSLPYFDSPTQVKFFDYGSEKYIGGIAYRDEVICGCCGGVFSMEELFMFAPDGVVPIEELDWQPFNEEIYHE